MRIRFASLLLLLPLAALAQTEVRKAVVVPSYKDLKFAPLPPLKIPHPETFTLPNGMKVYLLEDHELPTVRGVALIRTGNLFDPADKRGLAQMTGDVLRSGGTREKSGDQIDVQLENIAASVESDIGETAGTLSFSTLRENTPEVLGVFKSFLTSAEFRQDKVDLEKTQMRSAIARRNDDPGSIVGREFASILYGRKTPYGWETEYTDVDNITRQDLIDFYQRYYFPANILVGIYGDFSSAEMKDRLTKLFADWTVQKPPVPKFPEVRKTPVPGVFLATKTDVTQTFFAVGHMGGVFRDKDYPALEVAAEILGGGFSSRLFQRIRTKLGYAYNVGANWGANYDHPGLFEISGSTQSVHTVDTLKAIREEIDKIRSAPVTDQELQTAKDTVINGFVFNFDRPSKTLNRILLYQYYGYPENFIFDYQKAIGSVTKAEVLRVAKEYFQPDQLTVVAVGNPEQFGTPLTQMGFKVEPIDLTIPSPKKAPSGPVSEAGRQRGVELLHKMAQAMGGAEKLAAIKDVRVQADVSISAGPGAMKAKQRNSYVEPGAMRQDIELPFGKQSVFFADNKGWIAAPQGVQDMPAPVQKQMQGEIFRQIWVLPLSDRAPDRVINSTAPNVVEISDPQGNAAKLQLDASGLPQKISYDTDSGNGPVSIEESFRDWRDVNGIKIPYQATILQGGKKFADVSVTEFTINAGLKTEELSKKP